MLKVALTRQLLPFFDRIVVLGLSSAIFTHDVGLPGLQRRRYEQQRRIDLACKRWNILNRRTYHSHDVAVEFLIFLVRQPPFQWQNQQEYLDQIKRCTMSAVAQEERRTWHEDIFVWSSNKL